MSEMLHHALGEAIKVETYLVVDSWNVQADRNQLENALLNLAINTRDAIRGSDMPTITANNATLDNIQADVRDQLTLGNYLVFFITNTGMDMSPKAVKYTFEPFFTTKSDSYGTGLRLNMVFGFVKQSGGYVAIDSTVG